ncbi:nitrate- and nitrite sensing domain-containing protein [Actinomadura flavalba]|uniref:sensor histidine kinase n=1 Tax=Actinomadura flavalba TaxID=1120938 RepID=UPI00037162A8|nr:nitrate- and nitrite sensing domain-containing protein [Actinomadura flavalba]
MNGRLSSIRARITLVTLVPLVALVGLWIFATGITSGDAVRLIQGRDLGVQVIEPTQNTVDALQKERRLSMWRVGHGGDPEGADLAAQRRATDGFRAASQRAVGSQHVRERFSPAARGIYEAFVRGLGALEAVRAEIDAGSASRADVLRAYTGMIDAAFALYSLPVPQDGRVAADARAVTALARAREFLSREDALLSGVLGAGRLTVAERADFAQLVGAQRFLYADTVANLPGPDRDRYGRMVSSPEFARLRLLEDEVVRAAPRAAVPADTGRPATRVSRADRPPVSVRQWWSTADTVGTRLYDFENDVLDGVTARARDMALGVFGRLAIAGGLGLLAVVASALLAYRVARRLVRECRTLADAVVGFARYQLPQLAERVRSGEPVDPSAVPPDPQFRIDEIRAISRSFQTTREAVLIAAAGEVAARRGINEVFVNLARRNQALLHRQLALLDTMEHRSEDPSELADLFRLDHLATRMRRHAEGLVILAGKHAGRGWRNPVPLIDVVRGAVAEVEDYQRVRVQPMPRLALLGSAVADVIHLIAEIVENATTFSPPRAPVTISGHAAGNGYAIEIEDRGLGMDEDAVVAANAKLADPPDFDPADSAQLGLFVVARLAARHGIRVTLRPSPYGGMTAIALIPGNLVVEPDEPEPVARRSGPLALTPGPAPGGGAETAREKEGVVRLVTDPPAEHEPAPEPEQVAPRPQPAPVEATEAGLPRRRRQQNLAPQLRERVDARLAAERGEDPAGTGRHRATGPVPAARPVPLAAPVPPQAPPPQNAPEGPAEDARSPESLRSMMSAMQRGWERGRDAAERGPQGDAKTHPEQEDHTP